MRTRVKVCGVTRPEDARMLALAGVDALGIVFYPPSPRAVGLDLAREIIAQVPAFVTVVGLFVDPSPDSVESTLSVVSLDVLQFHGNETAEFCKSWRRPWIKAVRMRENTDLSHEMTRFQGARGLLLDSYVPGVPGGTGKTLDWSKIDAQGTLPVILAGGLDPDNVTTAIRQVKPWAVDVSGGVEALDSQGKRMPGVKSEAAVVHFLRGVMSA